MDLKHVLEAILFVAEEPVPTQELAQVTESAVDEVERTLVEMAEAEAGGVVVRRVGGGWRMFSHPEARPYLERFAASPAATRLSRAALETLAVVAYRQPVTRPQVSEIRGVDSDRSMATLERLGLVEDLGVGPGAGSPIMYGTSELFLEQLGINALDDLPPLADHVPPPEIVEALEAPFRPGAVEADS
jgi:segregation and condensation protein B